MKSPQQTTNILLCGVGGQGVLLASELLCAVAMADGLQAKKSEVHGMAQRGGSVVSHVRFGREVLSPLISLGEADGIMSFEYMESARYLDLLRPNGWIVSSRQRIVPLTAFAGEIPYPQDIEPALKKKAGSVDWVDALSIARQLGNKNVVNVVVLGALSRRLSFSPAQWEKTIEAKVPARFRELNLQAFRAGREAA